MTTQTKDINMISGGVRSYVNVSQYDVGSEIKFALYNNSSAFTPPAGTTVRVEGRKPDGNGFSYSASLSDNVVTVTVTDQMTVLSGEVLCELRLTKDSVDIGTANFILAVEEAPINSDIPISDTEIPAIIELARQEQYNAEAWAKGTRNGVPVSSDDPTYHNNAKYYGELINDYESNGYLSIQRAFKEELSHNIYGYNSGNPLTENAYLGIQKKYPVKVGDVVYLKFETTSLTPWYAITRYDSNGDYTGVLSQGYGTEANIPVLYNGFVSFVIRSGNSEFSPSSVSEFKFFTHYVTPNNKLTDISAIGTDESGRTTASKAYAIGEHFYKNGKFCTAKTAIASGATFTLNTNYVEGDISEWLASKAVTYTFADSNITVNASNTRIKKIGNILNGVLDFTMGNTSISGWSNFVTLSEKPSERVAVFVSISRVTDGTVTMTAGGIATDGMLTFGESLSANKRYIISFTAIY